MRQAWMPALVHCRLLQFVLAGGTIFASGGCHQHYHYYTNPACPPGTTAPATVQYGSMCDVPTQVVDAGSTLGEPSSRSTTVSGAKSSSRVVVSEPKDASPYSWRRSDPEASLATTTVEGGINGSTVNR